MVEGPGATKNARNARKLVGCRLASVDGADVPVGAKLADVLCLGKEVWLIFASDAAATGGDSDDDVVDLCGGSDKDERGGEGGAEVEGVVRDVDSSDGTQWIIKNSHLNCNSVNIFKIKFRLPCQPMTS